MPKLFVTIVDYDYSLIKWDTDAFVGSKSKKLINTHLKV